MKELTELKNEFYEVMYKYEKSFSEEGVMANLTAWQTAKVDLLSLLRRHPNWNEDEQAIIFDCIIMVSLGERPLWADLCTARRFSLLFDTRKTPAFCSGQNAGVLIFGVVSAQNVFA